MIDACLENSNEPFRSNILLLARRRQQVYHRHIIERTRTYYLSVCLHLIIFNLMTVDDCSDLIDH